MAGTAQAERDDRGHFTGQGECKIHTSRSHNSCKVGGEKGCDHQANCDTSGAKRDTTGPWVWGDLWESHHLLCISSVNAYQVLKAYDGQARENIDAVYRETLWCINQKRNLIALPMKVVYFKANATTARQNNLPCHNWDHNCTAGYTDEVIMKLHEEVWQKLKEVAQAGACKAAKEVKTQLPELSDHFREQLEKRAKRTVGSIQAAYDETKKPVDKRAEQWWFPFSMADNSTAAQRPAFVQGSDIGSRWENADTRVELRKQRWAVVRERS